MTNNIDNISIWHTVVAKMGMYEKYYSSYAYKFQIAYNR